jgi:recombinational DNA repair protein RecR
LANEMAERTSRAEADATKLREALAVARADAPRCVRCRGAIVKNLCSACALAGESR